ncbi:MAG: hypothetical protein NWF01_04485 [Candidatus Bathyarchaeota archaeon]|nr:hypothetical protein [Candidatus Bathyarchaeota archaeon]
MQPKQDNHHIRRGAELLMQGATLTDLSCPVCASPLFRLKDGTLWCTKDEKKVIIVKEGQEMPKPQPAPSAPVNNTAYDKLEATLMAKVQTVQDKLDKAEDPEEIQKLSTALSELLGSLEKIKQMKKQ